MKIVIILLTVLSSVLCFAQKCCFKVKQCVCDCDDSFIQIQCVANEGTIVILVSTDILIECETHSNINNINNNKKLLEMIPKINESYFRNIDIIDLHLDGCDLPYTFSTISEKFPPIKRLTFFQKEYPQNISQNFFGENSPLTNLTFNDPIVFAPVHMLRNLKNLQFVKITLQYLFHNTITPIVHIVPSNLFEGNINLEICLISLEGKSVKLPSKLFDTNDALKQVHINFYKDNAFEDELLSNKKKLILAQFESFDLAKPVPNKTFRNSTNLNIIWLKGFGLTNLDP